MAAPARHAAFKVLRAISTARIDLGDALSRVRDPLPDARDRALTTELVTGTLRWRGALDYQLQLRSTKGLHKLDGAVLDALRLGAYQLLHLERVPVSAVVNDSVDLVKSSGIRSAAPFANAVLRALVRGRETLTWPDRTDLVTHLAVVHSHPAWLVQRWVDRVGAETAERWLRFNNVPPAVTLATNRLLGTRDELRTRLQREDVATVPAAVAPHALTVSSGRPLATRTFADGYCLVQDEASQLVPELLQLAPTHRTLDACASPGGKTIAAAAACAPRVVIATDVRSKRMRVLAKTVARCRADNVRLAQIDPLAALPFREASFDRVLIDAPCSGLGTVRRDPDIRWRRSPEEFETFARAQVDLLDRVGVVVRPGGRIVYSTCSSEPEENEAVVAAFLERHAEFALVPLASAGLAPGLAAMETAEGYLRTSPDVGLELFFGAIFEKR